MDAIEYNKSRGNTRDQIKRIQRTVDAIADGFIGPKTIAAIKIWQTARGLKADGMVGPKTWAFMQTQSDCAEPDVEPNAQVGCGLAAYDQSWPNRTPQEAMQKAWDQSVAEGCTEIRFWSSEWLIDESIPGGGNKGNKYSGPWLERQDVPPGVVVGAWIDDPVWSASKDGFADRLASMHITRAALMINRSNTRKSDVPWELRWSKEQLSKIAAVYHSRGIDTVATCWPRPSRSQIDAMCDDMKWILKAIGSNVFEVDTEGNWTSRHLDGFHSMHEASVYLADKMRALVGDKGELELTTFTYHRENSSKAALAPLMDRLLPQAYSVRHRGNETIDWEHALGPGRHQKLAVRRARQAAR